MKFTALFILICPCFLFSQTELKKDFAKENYVHLKAGATFNETNDVLFNGLNSSGPDIFTPTKQFYANPSVDIEFESHFSKYIGLSIDLGFMQTRQRYHFTDNSVSPYTSSQNTKRYEPTEGLILSNIPHLNLSPCFYISESTRVFAGIGLYKYYYYFNPISIGSFGFNRNKEDIALYSNFGICQCFDVSRFRCSLTINCFGIAKQYDRGFQVALGTVF
jgi:hypothetical protein